MSHCNTFFEKSNIYNKCIQKNAYFCWSWQKSLLPGILYLTKNLLAGRWCHLRGGVTMRLWLWRLGNPKIWLVLVVYQQWFIKNKKMDCYTILGDKNLGPLPSKLVTPPVDGLLFFFIIAVAVKTSIFKQYRYIIIATYFFSKHFLT